MAPKKVNTRANSFPNEVAKTALDTKKGKVTSADNIPPPAVENTTSGSEAGNNKLPRTKDPPTPKGSIHTYSSESTPEDTQTQKVTSTMPKCGLI